MQFTSILSESSFGIPNPPLKQRITQVKTELFSQISQEIIVYEVDCSFV